MHQFTVYGSESRIFVISRISNNSTFMNEGIDSNYVYRILKIDRQPPNTLQLFDDQRIYSSSEIDKILGRKQSNTEIGFDEENGSLQILTKACAILGFFKGIIGYYVIFIKVPRFAGLVYEHEIYGIDQISLIPLATESYVKSMGITQEHRKEEERYRKYFNEIPFTRDFFFSFTYDLTRTVQQYIYGLSRGLVENDSQFFISSFVQRKFYLYGRQFTITIIARRSRHYSGTRFQKRGVSERGWVANDVETELIVIEDGFASQKIGSYVQCRGTVPVYWSQKTEQIIKPEIYYPKHDPLFDSSTAHFADLQTRYGYPTVVLSLLKLDEKKPRETPLHSLFVDAISTINRILPQQYKIIYIPFDYSSLSICSQCILC
ncbi:MAG: putative Phosphoinositide phosphatase SAC4 [Streblomastix strix]|uniref:Putative Phosphoinositide phosphatase SAC4 n=1 Tax=Streblomastix strix TaxID=222440 RepID=A0A5J4WXW4_9EUKA|nr:MAG: putative Phosphoinositide phosphatase SAC4 [Streblomastix strix]